MTKMEHMEQVVSRRDYFAVSALQALIEKNGKAWDTDGLFDCQTKREERDHEMVTLPSECRQRKYPCLTPWGDKGSEASWIQGLSLGLDTFHFDSLENTHSVVDWEDVIIMAIDLADRMIGELDG